MNTNTKESFAAFEGAAARKEVLLECVRISAVMTSDGIHAFPKRLGGRASAERRRAVVNQG